ncbi:MAG: HAMP domain-containing histidine kinase [Muribaculaceae bacterium]|nr:HAMP domain-containing histidine kinase [Muribaculaceae bacterium]
MATVSRRKFNLQARLFLTLVSLLWAVVITVGILLYNHERDTRKDVLTQQLDVFNSVLISHYSKGEELKQYLDYMEGYFAGTPLEGMSVVISDYRTHRYIDGSGYKFRFSDFYDLNNDGLINGYDMDNLTVDSIGFDPDDYFYYRTLVSPDSTLQVRTIMPYNVSVSQALTTDAFMWIIIFIMLIVMTIIAYVTSRHVSRNITVLRDFVTRAANDRDFVTFNEFPDDELGDITRQVVQIYNARSAAVAAREHEHNMALHAIEERSKLKRQLTNNISHELKTPVGIIKGYIDTILDEPSMDENARTHFLTKAQGQVNRLCDLLNDLSTMTRLEESNGTVSIEPIDFRELVSNTIEEVESSGIAGSMKLSMAMPYECIVMGNKALLNAMLLNLIKNATFYSRGTEMVIKCIDTSEHFYSFAFYDDGIGVPPESLTHLFERFYRVDTGRARRNGGTGLGLPIVKSTINALGGSITVANREAGGLQFTFTLRRPKK